MPKIFKKLKIGHRINLLAGIMLMFIIAISATSIYKMNAIGHEIKEIAERDMPLMKILSQITVHQLEQGILLEQGLRLGGVTESGEEHTAEKSVRYFKKLAHKVDDEIKQAEDMTENFLEKVKNPEAKKEFEHVFAQLKMIKKHHKTYDEHAFAVFEKAGIKTKTEIKPQDITPYAGDEAQPGSQYPAYNNQETYKTPMKAAASLGDAELTDAVAEVEREQEVLIKEIEALFFQIEKFTANAIDKALADEQRGIMLIITMSAVVFIASIIFAFLLGRSISKPIANMTDAMNELSGGNLDIETPKANFEDEVQDLSIAMEVFRKNMYETKIGAERAEQEKQIEAEKSRLMQELADNFDSEVGGMVTSLASASTELQSSAETMRKVADDTSNSSQTVASSSEEASTNVATVASAMEEMSASVSEIATQVTSAKTKASDTAQNAQKANETVGNLNQLAENIGEVVDAIKDIAEQTNLLALNATIESARAGEAGKGFAVVADEVKKLATETGQKTEEIGGRISEIQEATRKSVEAMERIIQNVSGIDESVTGVSAAVEEQNATTTEIVRSIAEASQGVKQVSQVIVEVQKGAGETRGSADCVLEAATEVAKLSDGLKGAVDQFLQKIRSDNDHAQDDAGPKPVSESSLEDAA